MAAKKKTAKTKTAKKTAAKTPARSTKTTTAKRSPAPKKSKRGVTATGLVYASALREMIARRLGHR